MRLSLIILFVLSLSTLQAQENTDQSTNSADYLQVTRYRLHPKDLSIDNEIDSEKVYIKIYYNNKGSVANYFAFFKPKKNEILFFYGKNSDSDTSEMYFKLHDSLKIHL